VRTAALHVLSRYDKDNPETLKLMVALTNQSDAAVALREAAIDGLSRSGSDADEVVSALCTTLVDKSVELRKASASALAAQLAPAPRDGSRGPSPPELHFCASRRSCLLASFSFWLNGELS
jgi:HEAT repeat protein